MYSVCLIVILLLIVLLYSFTIEENINILCCIIIILLLNSLFYKKSYEKYSNNYISISDLQDSYSNKLNDKIVDWNKENNRNNEANFTNIKIYSSKFKDLPKRVTCENIKINDKDITVSEFTKILNKIQIINNPN